MIFPDDDEARLELFPAILKRSSDAIVFVDSEQRIRFWSRSAELLFETAESEFPFSPKVRSAVCHELTSADEAARRDKKTGEDNPLCSDSRRDKVDVTQSAGGTVRMNRDVIQLQIGGHRWKMVVFAQTVERDARQAELERQACTDPLSELLNRRGFQSALESHLNRPLTLAIIDVDYFKRINDSLGHSTGDEAIQWIAQSIQSSFGDAICIGRLGGDEFGVVLISQPLDETETRFKQFCRRVETNSSECAFQMTISIGVAVAAQPGIAARTLLSHADQAMYRSKPGA